MLGRKFDSLAIGSLLFGALLLSGCGSSKTSSGSKTPSSGSVSTATSQAGTLALSITESGKTAQFTTPTSAKGGLVTVTFKNQGKQPHSAQLVLMKGNHTVADVLKAVGGNNTKTPSWLHAEGGVGLTPPGQTGTATVNLPAGHYGLIEVPGPGSGPPASAEFQVSAGQSGALPSSTPTVTAATAGKESYKWAISGSLKPGANRVTFESKGKDAIHVITAVQITGNPSRAAIIKGLESNGPPPSFVNIRTIAETAALDGGKSSVTELNIAAPGRYLLFCPISDRNGGKPHFAKGLLKIVTVK